VGCLRLICRLAVRDLLCRRGEAVLLLLAITAATATLTLGLALNGVTSQPFKQTKAATRGPDVVASFLNVGPPGPSPAQAAAAMNALAREPGVAARSGPFPVSWPTVRVHGLTAGVLAEGRDPGPAAVDQPALTQGGWVRPGGVVVERSFAGALGVGVGTRLTLNGRRFTVVGIAVSAANAAYPQAFLVTDGGAYPSHEMGMMWLTRADAASLAPSSPLPLSYLLNLKLADPAQAAAFVAAHSGGQFSILGLTDWQVIAATDDKQVQVEETALVAGSSLLSLLAVASVTVLVGGRIAEEHRRVGLLKAVGGTPKLVAAVLLAQNLIIALAAAAAGLAAGRLAAPLLTSPGSGLVGAAGAPSLTVRTGLVVTGLAVGVAIVATAIPALRAARKSTVAALADTASAPRRTGWLIQASRRLPVPLLLGLRMAGRRPRRLVLTTASVAITVAAIVAALAEKTHYQHSGAGYSMLNDPVVSRLDRVLVVVIVVLMLLAAVNAIFIVLATARDTRHSAALARALGASTEQVSSGLSAAMLVPGLAGVIAGIPAGIALVALTSHGGSTNVPPAWSLVAVLVGTLAVLAGLAVIPARAGARLAPAEVLGREA
jgi:ABC-type antimicrobial peptide transport system permease subunit